MASSTQMGSEVVRMNAIATMSGRIHAWAVRNVCFGLFMAAALAESGFAQKVLTWQEVRDKFEAANPTLQAGQIGIDEFRAQEITAYLRPNPTATLLTDQLYPFYTDAYSGTKGTAANIGYRPFENSLVAASFNGP